MIFFHFSPNICCEAFQTYQEKITEFYDLHSYSSYLDSTINILPRMLHHVSFHQPPFTEAKVYDGYKRHIQEKIAQTSEVREK